MDNVTESLNNANYALLKRNFDNTDSVFSLMNCAEQIDDISDGYHTFGELYTYRMLYNAGMFNCLSKVEGNPYNVHKSKRHHTGEECFGGGWFIVVADLPTGQITNHYELSDWDLFNIPEKEIADMWDGHSPREAADRLRNFLLS